MSLENIYQRLLFAISRKFNAGAQILLGFTLLWWLGGLLDTLLWGLDAPGYINHKQLVSTSTKKDFLLQHPASVITYTKEPGDVAELKDIPGIFGSSLFKPGFNFTLTKGYDQGKKAVIRRPSYVSFHSSGPRLWLDEEGFSITVNLTAVSGENCVIIDDEKEETWHWSCPIAAADALRNFESPVCIPMVVYDNLTEAQGQQQFVSPNKYDNLWSVLAGGDHNVGMQQIFSVRKGNMRHIFQVEALKIAVRNNDKPLDDNEIKEYIKLITAAEPTTGMNALVDQIISFKNMNQSGAAGVIGVNDNYTIFQDKFEYLFINSTLHARAFLSYSILRYSTYAITLLRSDRLTENVHAWEPCDKFYQNEASGGRIYQTSCYSSSGNQTNARFLGEVDATATALMINVLGVGHYNKTSQALNVTAFKWLENNSNTTMEYLTARALTIIDPFLTTIELSETRMALSWLQVFLILICFVLALTSMLLVHFFSAQDYSMSLFSALCRSVEEQGVRGSGYGLLTEGYVVDPPDVLIADHKPERMEFNFPHGIFQLTRVEPLQNLQILRKIQ